MTNHVVLLGYGILAKILIEGYKQSGKEFIVIDNSKNMDTDREILQENERLLISPYPGNRNILIRARISEASLIIINFENDSDTIFAIMNVTEFLTNHPTANKPQILARIYYEENIAKAKLAGADIVIAPHLLAAAEIKRLGLA
ncbi:MAG TPA: NAD-binding protein [Burkholderiales bacterium]|nr:NAD-binding protein [Burkholderiales bacterium]